MTDPRHLTELLNPSVSLRFKGLRSVPGWNVRLGPDDTIEKTRLKTRYY